jgi:Ran GTPase-activating protein (RanGAP) involved in mRNA processing and transport
MKSGKIIDIKNNSIGKLGSQHLSQCLANKDCWLEELNIEDNKLGD